MEGKNLRLIDTVTGERLLWVDEVDRRLAEETAARKALEEELARLRSSMRPGRNGG